MDHRDRPQPREPTADRRGRRRTKEELDRWLDEALEGTFPASDPVALALPERAD